MDIRDLKIVIVEIENVNLKVIYGCLMEVLNNYFVVFFQNLEQVGEVYVFSYIIMADYDVIMRGIIKVCQLGKNQ